MWLLIVMRGVLGGCDFISDNSVFLLCICEKCFLVFRMLGDEIVGVF